MKYIVENMDHKKLMEMGAVHDMLEGGYKFAHYGIIVNDCRKPYEKGLIMKLRADVNLDAVVHNLQDDGFDIREVE